MNSRSEHCVADDGARVELGVVAHEGREYAAMGSVVDHAHGSVVGYVGKVVDGRRRALTTWDGRQIGVCWSLSTWRNPNSYFSSTMSAFRALVDGKMYHGRGAGEGCILKLRAFK